MITLRKNDDSGRSQTPWLNSFHTFSFAEYRDPKLMGYGSLRVMNEDTVQPGCGFMKHPHHHMEIISYVVEGSLEHRDSLGNGSIIKPGEIQMMSAGEGIEHSEFNPSKKDLLHFLQIWITPKEFNSQPSYQQKTLRQERNKWILIGSSNGQEGTININQDIDLYVAYLTHKKSVQYSLEDNRMGWLQLIKGEIKLNDYELSAGDGSAIQDEDITIYSVKDAEFLFFDLAS